MKYECFWTSIRGHYWIPCTVLAWNRAINEVTIRYFDDVLQWYAEASVIPENVREVPEEPTKN